MAKEYAKAFYHSKAWKDCKAGYISTVHGICERCGEPGQIVHHKIRLTKRNINNPEVALNYNNLELLCLKCHNEEHEVFMSRKRPTKKGFRFDEKGQIVPVN